MNILQIEHVTKRYAGHTALDDVSLEVPQGSIYGLLGPNGAGKTTLIRVINRITLPDAGTVIFNGHPITDDDIHHIGYLPEERGLYKKMKVGQQAIFFARLKGLSRREAVVRLKKWFVRFGIEDWWDKKVEDLSKGMAQKVQFITTVVHEPRLLIFDEPFSGFDPINANLLKRGDLRRRPRTTRECRGTHGRTAGHHRGERYALPHHTPQAKPHDVGAQHRCRRERRGQPAFGGALRPAGQGSGLFEPRPAARRECGDRRPGGGPGGGAG